jgi:hypothetical protein
MVIQQDERKFRAAALARNFGGVDFGRIRGKERRYVPRDFSVLGLNCPGRNFGWVTSSSGQLLCTAKI